MLGDQLPASALASARTSVSDVAADTPSGRDRISSCSVAVVMVLQSPGLNPLEELRRPVGHYRKESPHTCGLHLAGPVGALPGLGRVLEAGQHLGIGLVPASDVAVAGLGAVSGGAFSGGHGGLLKIRFQGDCRMFYYAR